MGYFCSLVLSQPGVNGDVATAIVGSSLGSSSSLTPANYCRGGSTGMLPAPQHPGSFELCKSMRAEQPMGSALICIRAC